VAVLLAVAGRSGLVRDLGTTLAFLVFLAEFMVAALRGIVRPNPLMRAAVWILGLSFALILAILRVLGTLPSPPAALSGPALEAWGLLAAIGYLVAWGGLVLLLDLQGLLAELERQNRELNEIAVTDALTGFLNRRLLQSNMVEEMERASRFKQPLSLILFDLDHFKGVNDNFGHQTGDAVLTQVAGIANSTIRKSDRAYRWGGEEFLLVLPNTARDGAYHLAEKLRRAVSSAVFPVVGSMTISLGVAEWGGAEDMDHWFRRLDLALYRAKNCGRNRVEYIEPGEDLEGAVFKVVWQADWSSGNGVIDGQHKKLLDLCNVLLGRSLSHAPEAEIRRLLDGLNELCVRHFADEEEILEDIGYPELEEHKGLHRKLLSQANEIRARADSGEGATAGEYFDFLVDTVVMRHIVKEDAPTSPTWSRQRSGGAERSRAGTGTPERNGRCFGARGAVGADFSFPGGCGQWAHRRGLS
jgi:diguanylate cyclase (GGDEF)-like protein/hemerythrin-like metal-binding protein